MTRTEGLVGPGVRPAPTPGDTIWRQLQDEIRWAFRPPWTWLTGVAANLVLSLLYLLAEPLVGRPHRDWAVMVGTYFAVFILADVTTTNVLGADSIRVRLSLLRQVPLVRILLVKNLALFVIVGVPTLLATALITVNSEPNYRLVLTLPGVAYPILTWLGVGNLVSVLLPVAAASLRERWAWRRRRETTVRWLAALGLPYLLCVAVDPLSKLPALIRRFAGIPRTAAFERGAVLLLCGVVLWAVATGAALVTARIRKIRFDDVR